MMSNDILGAITIRAYTPSDRNFIRASFIKGLYYGNEFFNMIPKDIFMKSYHPAIEALIDKSIIRLAVLKEDPNIIVGYSLCSGDGLTLHWVKVKAAWGKNGIGKKLIPSSIKVFSHFTKLGLKLNNKLKYTFNPFAL